MPQVTVATFIRFQRGAMLICCDSCSSLGLSLAIKCKFLCTGQDGRLHIIHTSMVACKVLSYRHNYSVNNLIDTYAMIVTIGISI